MIAPVKIWNKDRKKSICSWEGCNEDIKDRLVFFSGSDSWNVLVKRVDWEAA